MKSTPVMSLCNYRLINAIFYLIKMLVECKYLNFNVDSIYMYSYFFVH